MKEVSSKLGGAYPLTAAWKLVRVFANSIPTPPSLVLRLVPLRTMAESILEPEVDGGIRELSLGMYQSER